MTVEYITGSQIYLIIETILVFKNTSIIEIDKDFMYERFPVKDIDDNNISGKFFAKASGSPNILNHLQAIEMFYNSSTEDLVRNIGRYIGLQVEIIFENWSPETLEYFIMDKSRKLISQFTINPKNERKAYLGVGTPWVIRKISGSTAILALYLEPVENQVAGSVRIITDIKFDTEAKRILNTFDSDRIIILHDETGITCKEPTKITFDNGSILTKKDSIYYEKYVEKDGIEIFKKDQTVYIPKGRTIQTVDASLVVFELQTRVERREIITWKKEFPVPLIVGIDMIFKVPVQVRTEVPYTLKKYSFMTISKKNKILF